jgi:hypothetical protein
MNRGVGRKAVNAMESAVSTMETQVIGSRNVANPVSSELWG